MPKAILIARAIFCYGTIVRIVENIPKQNLLFTWKNSDTNGGTTLSSAELPKYSPNLSRVSLRSMLC